MTTGVDPARLEQLYIQEMTRFIAARPMSAQLWQRAKGSMPNGVPMSWMRVFFAAPPVYVAEGRGSHFRDVDGVDYADFNIADISMFGGYAPAPVVEAVGRAVARGSQFMMATEDAVWVAEELARRYGLPKWQFTLSASQANTEALRVARAATGRDKVLLFDGKYHGHFDDALVELRHGRIEPEERGLPRSVVDRAKIIQFNDPEALRTALEERDVAAVLTEPAMTNVVGLVLPDPGFHDTLRMLTESTGTVLIYDETHTQVMGRGGLTARWQLRPDIVSMGKSIAGGVPLGAYGVSEALAGVLECSDDPAQADGHPPVATGGTLFGNPLSMAAARATLSEVLDDAAYAHSQHLGTLLSTGIEQQIARAGVAWTTLHLGPRSGVCFGPRRPRNAQDAYASRDLRLSHTMWTYFANRGLWDALIGAGPTCSVAATEEDVNNYISTMGMFLDDVLD